MHSSPRQWYTLPRPHIPTAHFSCTTRKLSLLVVQLTDPVATCTKASVRHYLGDSPHLPILKSENLNKLFLFQKRFLKKFLHLATVTNNNNQWEDWGVSKWLCAGSQESRTKPNAMETNYLNCVEEPKILYPKKKSVSKYVSLLSDCGFKYVFGKIANKEIIIAFLNQVIPDRVIVDIEQLRNEQLPYLKDRRTTSSLLFTQ